MLWHLGNTTIRTPYRLRDALIALQASPLNGNLIGENENEFTILLHNAGIADVTRINAVNPQGEIPDLSDFGRKWRSALTKMGFITQKLTRQVLPGEIDPVIAPIAASIPGLSGRPYEITPSGYRLINSEVIAAQQESFLRSVLSIKLPSVIEPRFNCDPFSPLKYVINLILKIQELGQEPYLSFEEIALFVLTTSPDNNIDQVANDIIDFRLRRRAHQGAIRSFDRLEYYRVANGIPIRPSTLDDYADCTLRYLKATGLFKSKGRGIAFNPVKEELALLIHNTEDENLLIEDYLVKFWNGSPLPTDNVDAEQQVINNLIERIRNKGGVAAEIIAGEDVTLKRHMLEDQLNKLEEIEYYQNQANCAEEISCWIDALKNGSSTLHNGERITVPRGEAPAYFEWVIWRVFLAINSLVNRPWEARRFQIDQDFLPTGTAPGNGPDMVFEFEDAILVVEVTFTNSSRQEAAEGEPVRRHVAKYVEEQGEEGKAVYGLFIAINIDSNTANTFRMGDWFKKDDSKVNLQIVPIKLEDFSKLFSFGIGRLDQMPTVIQSVLLRCRAQANQDAPVWKRTITSIIDQTVR